MAAALSRLLRYAVDRRTIAFLTGAVLTPVALGLSLQFWPIGAPLLIYAGATAVFAYREPEKGWRWGLWTGGGHLAAVLLVALVSLIAGGGTASSGAWPFLRIATIFGLLPAVAGACLGGAAIEFLSQVRYELFGLVLFLLLAASVVLLFVG